MIDNFYCTFIIIYHLFLIMEKSKESKALGAVTDKVQEKEFKGGDLGNLKTTAQAE